MALMEPGDTLMGMDLAAGGHLTHGSRVNFSGKLYKVVSYGVRPDTELIDLEEVRRLALEHRPKVIVAGASAYPRFWDFKAFGRSPTRWGPTSWWTWPTSPGSWPRASTRTPCLTPTW